MKTNRNKLISAFVFLFAILIGIFALKSNGILETSNLQNGDIIFHTSRSNQSYAIMWASKSLLSHVGVIEIDGQDAFVIEAIGKVSRTPLKKWIERGRLEKFEIYRLKGLEPERQQGVIANAKSLLGRKYDLFFTSGNDEIYCSELVEMAYAKTGISLGRYQTVSELDIDNPVVRRLVEQRWRKHPACANAKSFDECWRLLLNDKLITPVSIARDARLTLIKSTY